MRKKDKLKYEKKYGGDNKKIWYYRNPKEFNLATAKRELDVDGSIVVLAYLKKKRKSAKLIRVMKVIEKNRQLREFYRQMGRL